MDTVARTLPWEARDLLAQLQQVALAQKFLSSQEEAE